MALPSLRTHTDAVIAALEAAGLTVGDAEKPDGAGWQGTAGQSDFEPYAVVYSIPGGGLSGPAGAPDDDGELIRQVSYFGRDRQQAEWALDQGRAALLSGITVSGRNTARVTVDIEGGVERDDDVQPPVFMAVDRYRIFSFPA